MLSRIFQDDNNVNIWKMVKLVNYNTNDEYIEWLNNNPTIQFCMGLADQLTIWFKYEEDAILFKLTFL